jgi:uncharacterized repeat protein (TIGR02059 family)
MKREINMRKLFFLILIILSSEVNGQFYPVTIKTIRHLTDVPDGTDISTLLTNMIAECNDGDVIVLPQGKFVISDKVIVSCKDISIIGQGADSISGTMLYRNAAASVEFLLYWDIPDLIENPVFVSNIYLKGRPSARYGGNTVSDVDFGIIFNNVHNFYCTDNIIQYVGARGISVYHQDSIKEFNGLIFDNNILDIYRPEIANLGYGVGASGQNTDWITDPEFGSEKFVFYEDNYFRETRHAIDGHPGGKYVFRYNTVEDNWFGSAIDAHGAALPTLVTSTRAVEIYNNTITNKYDIDGNLVDNDTPADHYSNTVINIRGGEALVYNNKGDNYRYFGVAALDEDYPGVYPGAYPSPYQVGYLSGLVYGVSDTIYKADHGDGDVFMWNNTYTTNPGSVTKYAVVGDFIKYFRDLDTVAKPGYVAYPYPHPYRNYYYSFIDSLNVGTLSNVIALSLGQTSVVLKWDDVLCEDGYRVYMSSDGINFTLEGSTGMNVVSKTISGLAADNQYWFYIAPYNDAHEGQKSNTLSIKISPSIPIYVNSVIENTNPSILEMIYNLSLTNIVPAASAFTVKVNSYARTVSSVALSGTKVLLTLASPVAYGDVVTVAYTKPSTYPLQTSAGGQAATITAQNVTNKVAAPAVPVYVSTVIENTTPSQLEMTYNLSLTNIVPAASAFTVRVNSVARTINSVAISGTKVLLTLSSPVTYGDIITVAYTKPSTNPLQTAAGGQVASITAQPVTNRVAVVNIAPVVVVTFPSNSYSGFVNEISASGSYDANKDNLTFTWSAPVSVPLSSKTGATIRFLGPIVNEPSAVEFTVNVSDGKTTKSKIIPVEILPYKSELEAAEVSSVEVSSYYSLNYPHNIIDGNIGTMWSANGVDQWLIIELKELFSIHHVKLAFQPGQKRISYFDVLGSDDKETWEPILTKSASCDFSGDLQVFDFPPSKAGKEFKYVKLAGKGSSTDSWNYFSEMKVFGYRHPNPSFYENLAVKLYPNPAREIINLRIDEPTLSLDFIRIINLLGDVVFQDIMNPDIKELQIPINLQNGVYIVQLGSGDLTLFAQKLIVSLR